MRKLLGIGVLLAAAATAHAEKLSDAVNLYSVHANPTMAVVAVDTSFAVEAGKAVRLTVYDSEEGFLETPRAKFEAQINQSGIAVLPLEGLDPGVYAFAAYLDEDGDGKLKRGKILGRPKEPIAFSNGVKIKMRKPNFGETKVNVAPGDVIVITLDD